MAAADAELKKVKKNPLERNGVKLILNRKDPKLMAQVARCAFRVMFGSPS